MGCVMTKGAELGSVGEKWRGGGSQDIRKERKNQMLFVVEPPALPRQRSL